MIRERVISFADVRERFMRWISNQPEAVDDRVSRIEFNVCDADPLTWLRAQADPVKGYWSARDARLEIAALGEADVLRGGNTDSIALLNSTIAARLEQAKNARYFGGFRFDRSRVPDPTWQAFGSYRFVLPMFEWVRDEQGSRIACNFIAGLQAKDRYKVALESLTLDTSVACPAPDIGQRWIDQPDRATWCSLIEKGAKWIRQGNGSKIVLARQRIFSFDRPPDPFLLLSRLRLVSPDCYLFAGVHGGRVAFMGAPPERLYRRLGSDFQTEAVAGTRARGTDPASDHALARELIESEKERDEHRLVVAGIRDRVQPLCKEWMQEQHPHVAKFRTVQHLVTRCSGRLRESVTDAAILSALHPTAAVAGHPREAAMEFIREHEPFDRGWYAGPVGWMGHESAEFAVAIRCGVIAGSALCLFAGAGIMNASQPEMEWQETEIKLDAFIAALTRD